MKTITTLALLGGSTIASHAALTAIRDYSAFADTTGVTPDGAYVWGMEVNPINNVANVDVDGNGTFDFHASGTTTIDTSDGYAGHADGTLFRWDYGGSPSRAAGYEEGGGADYTFEIGLDILGTGTEGTRGVFGVALEFGSGSTSGDVQFEIGEDSITFLNGDSGDIAASFATADNTGYHTWRFAHDNAADTLYIFKDGLLIDDGADGFDLTVTNTASPGNTFIGDYSTGLAGDWNLDYIAFDTNGAFDVPAQGIPEPSSTALLGVAGLGLLIRRRK